MSRSIAPNYTQAKNLDLVFPAHIKCANNVDIFWIKDVKDDSVKIDIEWTAGTKFQSKKLVAGFTNKLLLSGTESKSANQISEEIDFYGGYTHLEVDKDNSVATLYGLRDTISSIFDLFVDAFGKASFPEDELAKERDISASRFLVDMEKGKDLCRRSFNQNLFGPKSAYGHVAEYEDFGKLNRADLQAFYQEYYTTKPTIFVIGAVDQNLINELKTWAETFQNEQKVNFIQNFNQHKGRINVEKKDALQSAIRIGRLMFDKKNPDYYHFQLLNTILGGYFGSRLMANIREDKGYTYGIGSGMAVLQDVGYFFISTEVAAEVKEQTINEVYKELELLSNELISEDELLKVKNYMLGEFLRDADGPNSQMEIFKNIYFNDLPHTFYSDFIKAIHNCTVVDLQQIAQKYLNRKEMLEVVAG